MRTTTIQPTVPLAEFGITGLSHSDAEAWAHMNGVHLTTDYLGRQAVTLADAYKVAEARAEAEAQAQHTAELVAAAANAQRERERIYNDATVAYLSARRTTPEALNEARRQAWKAVKEAERDLPREVRDRLTGVPSTFVQTFKR